MTPADSITLVCNFAAVALAATAVALLVLTAVTWHEHQPERYTYLYYGAWAATLAFLVNGNALDTLPAWWIVLKYTGVLVFLAVMLYARKRRPGYGRSAWNDVGRRGTLSVVPFLPLLLQGPEYCAAQVAGLAGVLVGLSAAAVTLNIPGVIISSLALFQITGQWPHGC